MNFKIYICHYAPLVERKQYLDNVLPELNIPYEFSSLYTRDNLTEYSNMFSTETKDLDHKNKYSTTQCNSPLVSPSIKATNLEHLHILKELTNSPYEAALVLEDDAVIVTDFAIRLQDKIDCLPADWDIVFMNSGCGGRDQQIKEALEVAPPVNGFLKMPRRQSWTAGGYFIKRATAEKFIKHILPMALPIDFELTYLQNLLQSNVYWLEDPLIYDGSNKSSGEYFKYPSSHGFSS
jgi:GR25 family glycosyltransferase involved in LPS biosynthesis